MELDIEKQVFKITSLQAEVSHLQSNNSTLKSDPALLKSRNEELSKDVSAKATELKVALERATRAVSEKSILEEKLKQVEKDLLKAEVNASTYKMGMEE